jgi:phenylacetate-CoA ligase
MLIDGIKPLVRYRTGDFVEIYKTEKPEPYDLKINIIGRTKDRIQLNGNMFSAFDIESSILDVVTHCYGYQIIIDQKNGEDYLDINLEFAEDTSNIEAMLAAVKASCARQLRINVNVQVISELDQVVSTAAFVSWKAARIVDRRTKEIDRETQVAQKMAEHRGYR